MAYLVAVDDSHAAECAFRRALELAKGDTRIFVLCVAPDPSDALLAIEGDGMAFAAVEAARTQGHDAAKATLHKFGTMAKAAHREVVLLLGHGDPAEQIVTEAKNRGVDSIVVGRRSMGTVTRWFAGSESMKVIEQADVNVVVVHDK